MSDPNWWSVVISILALVFAILSWWISIKSGQKVLEIQNKYETNMRTLEKFDAAKRFASQHAAKIAGIWNAVKLANNTDNVTGETASNALVETGKLYSEVRDFYGGIKHYFGEDSQYIIDSYIQEIEEFGPSTLAGQLSSEMINKCMEFPTKFLEVIENEISLLEEA